MILFIYTNYGTGALTMSTLSGSGPV